MLLPLTGVVQLAASHQVACARLTDGTVQCWGQNEWRQAGDPAAKIRTAPGPVAGVSGATAIFVEPVRACASVAGGKLVCWGNVEKSGLWSEQHDSKTATPTEVKGITDVAQIDDNCVRHTDGTVTCWGLDLKPTKIAGIKAATQIEDDCARMDGGRVACWGSNDQCRLGRPKRGDEADDTYRTAQPMAVKNADQTFDGGCALTYDGSMWCHGACDDPALKKLAFEGVQRVVERCVILEDTTVACASKVPGTPYERLSFAPKVVPGIANVTRLAVASDLACAVRGDSDLFCWGDRKQRGLVGDGTKLARAQPVHVLGAAGP